MQDKPELSAIFDAYFSCRKEKRNTLNQLEFEFNLEPNLMQLFHDLKNNKYEIGPSLAFVIKHPKIREVWASDFRDRVVHHLIYNKLYERFTRQFIRDSYACIPGRGTHDALNRVSSFARSVTLNGTKPAYYLKADVANFFNSIDKGRLINVLDKGILPHEDWIRKLIYQILNHDPRSNVITRSSPELFKKVPVHKSFMRSPSHLGLPIGNLVSQFFANIYMNRLDQFVKHKLKIKYYARYVDDIIIMHENPQQLNLWYNKMSIFLEEELKLYFHPNKKHLNTIDTGINFTGFIIKPGRTYLRNSSVNRCNQKIRAWKRSNTPLEQDTLENISATVTSYLAMLRHVNGFKARKSLCSKVENLFIQADNEFTKILPVKNSDNKKK